MSTTLMSCAFRFLFLLDSLVRQVKLRHCEYIKSRLLNKLMIQKRLILLWQKEMWEIPSGIYVQPAEIYKKETYVSALLHSVEARDEHL